MPFQKGRAKTGGRKKGVKNKNTELKTILEDAAPAVIKKAVEMALEGDPQMIKLCADKLLPNLKATEVSTGNVETVRKLLLHV